MDEKPDRADLVGGAFRRYYRQVYRYLLRRTGSPERAEELTQEVFADAASALENFGPGQTSVLALLYTLAQRRFADAARRGGRQPVPLPLEELGVEPPELEHDPMLAQALRRALAALPPEQGVVATMKLVQGRPFAEIARSLGVSEVACGKRFQRALKTLRSLLEQEGFEL